jgi:hypothetical protein
VTSCERPVVGTTGNSESEFIPWALFTIPAFQPSDNYSIFTIRRESLRENCGGLAEKLNNWRPQCAERYPGSVVGQQVSSPFKTTLASHVKHGR